MAALRMNGGEEKEEKVMEFTGKQIQEARERIAPFVDETPLLRLTWAARYMSRQSVCRRPGHLSSGGP